MTSESTKKAFHGGGGLYSVVGSEFEHLERSREAVNADGLDAWFDPSPQAVAKLSQHLNFSIKTSPPVHGTGLIQAISRARQIPEKNLLISGGSSDIMFELFPNLRLKKVLILDPMYGEYKHIFENVLEDIELLKFTLLPENDFTIDVDELIGKTREDKPDALVIVNPNSPTGKYLDREAIVKILQDLPAETLFVIDETYIDYAGTNQSAETLVPKHDNLVIIKSMSKVYSLSGARVAYMAASEKIIEEVDKYTPPFQVSLPAQILAVEVLKDTGYYQEKWEETDKLREEFIQNLKDSPHIKIHSGVGNFFLIELLNNLVGKAEEIVKRLAQKNVFVRDAASMSEQFHGNFIRVAVKDAETNDNIVAAFKEVL